MIQRNELPTLKTLNQVDAAIAGTDGTNSAVATFLNVKRWVAVALRQYYHRRRV